MDIITLLQILHFLSAGYVTAVIITRYQRKQSSLGWLIAIWLIPLSALLYMLLGLTQIKTKKKLQLKSKQACWAHSHLTQEMAAKAMPKLWQMSQQKDTWSYHHNQHIELFIDGQNAIPAILASIQEAKTHIGISMYIFQDDAVGLKILHALQNAHERGVVVNLMVDGMGSINLWLKQQIKKHKFGFKINYFMPPTKLFFINIRNHSKIIVIDHHTTYINNMNTRNNIISETTALFPNLKPDSNTAHNLAIKIQGPIAQDALRLFEYLWKIGTDTTPHIPKLECLQHTTADACVGIARLNYRDFSERFYNASAHMLACAISEADEHIRIVTPYLKLPDFIYQSLLIAKKRGVLIEIVIPKKTDQALTNVVNQSSAKILHGKGIQMHENKHHHFDHSKFMIIDGKWSLVGSTNMSTRSFFINAETDLEIIDSTTIKQLIELFNKRKGPQIMPQKITLLDKLIYISIGLQV